MVKRFARLLAPAIVLAALPATALAQDLHTVLSDVAKTLGADDLRTLYYSASGSAYEPGLDSESDPSRSHVRLKSYTRELDLEAGVSRAEIVRLRGTPPVEQAETQIVTRSDAWSKQFDLWSSPYTFLKGAMANNASIEAQTVKGQEFTLVTFLVQDRYKVTGFVDEENRIARIHTWIGDSGETIIESSFMFYEDFGGLMFPTTLIQKQDGQLVSVLQVSDVRPNAPVSLD